VPSMLGKSIMLTIIAACGVASGAATPVGQHEKKPPEEIQKGQHFCCTDVDKFTGEGCVAINAENINTCDRVLYCAGNWQKKDGKVTCE
jgi:hypothetical protein